MSASPDRYAAIRPGRFKKKRRPAKAPKVYIRIELPDGRVLEALGKETCMELLRRLE